MAAGLRVVDGVTWHQFAIVNLGRSRNFLAGKSVMVETWALDWGKHEFDYELNSRLTANGRPQAIATTEEGLRREFMERRVVSRYPIPVSIGMNGLRALPDVEFTLGGAKPQVYASRINTSRLAWSLKFRSHRYVGAVGGKRASAGRATSGAGMPGMGRGAGMATGFDYLMVHLPLSDYTAAQVLPRGLGTTDVIGREPGLLERWIARVTGQ